jgi:hypothetical protein
MNIDRAFVDRVEAVLGPPATVEVTPTGRTVLRYDATDDDSPFVVSMEARRPIACRRIPSGVEFAPVVADGLGEWRASKLDARPNAEDGKATNGPDGVSSRRVKAVKRMAEEGTNARDIASRLQLSRRLVAAILAA